MSKKNQSLTNSRKKTYIYPNQELVCSLNAYYSIFAEAFALGITIFNLQSLVCRPLLVEHLINSKKLLVSSSPLPGTIQFESDNKNWIILYLPADKPTLIKHSICNIVKYRNCCSGSFGVLKRLCVDLCESFYNHHLGLLSSSWRQAGCIIRKTTVVFFFFVLFFYWFCLCGFLFVSLFF